jgi:mRNA interferase MazF
MVKARPAIVLSPRLRHRDGLCAVIPLSTTHDGRDLPYIVTLRLSRQLPEPYDTEIMWAKCDMLATVSYHRLDLFRLPRDHMGKRKFLKPLLPKEDFERVMTGVMHGLGISAT